MLKILDKKTSRPLVKMSQHEDKMIKIGTDAQCDIQIDDLSAEPVHALVFKEQGAWYVKDNRSLTGTYVNDKRVQKHKMRSWDELLVGNSSFVLLDTAKMSVPVSAQRPLNSDPNTQQTPADLAYERPESRREAVKNPILHLLIGLTGLLSYWLYSELNTLIDEGRFFLVFLGVTVSLASFALQLQHLIHIKLSALCMVLPLGVLMLLFFQAYDGRLWVPNHGLIALYYAFWLAILGYGCVRSVKS